MDNFRAQSAPDGWATAGYSAGAHCATKLAVAHPDRYRAAISLSGYNDPIGERNSLAAQSAQLRRQNNPYFILKGYRTPPRVSLYLSGESGDGYQAAAALQEIAKSPTQVRAVLIPRSAGGHSMALWRPQIPTVFTWLSQQLSGRATGNLPQPHWTAGSRHAELASGTSSPSGVVRKR
jgi:S-formylglutathione hydrolase FrmB